MSRHARGSWAGAAKSFGAAVVEDPVLAAGSYNHGGEWALCSGSSAGAADGLVHVGLGVLSFSQLEQLGSESPRHVHLRFPRR